MFLIDHNQDLKLDINIGNNIQLLYGFQSRH